ncbi:hypothetical protein MTO96_010616 [Rhipicephalus appendiculatus]
MCLSARLQKTTTSAAGGGVTVIPTTDTITVGTACLQPQRTMRMPWLAHKDPPLILWSWPGGHHVPACPCFLLPSRWRWDGRQTLSPVHYARATSEECPMLCASGPAATWRRHHIQEQSTTAGIAGATVPLGAVSLRHLWFFSCSLLFVGATVSLVSAALAVVAWRLLHEPAGSELARNASSVVARAASLSSVDGSGDARHLNFTASADDHQSPAVTAKPRGNENVSSSPPSSSVARRL